MIAVAAGLAHEIINRNSRTSLVISERQHTLHAENRNQIFRRVQGRIGEKLELVLREIIGVGGICPTARLMVELCNTRTRSLHRHIMLEGQSYKAILDRVRHEKACALLTSDDLSIKEIAFSLGYSGANSFVRAFQRLGGTAPAEFRKTHAQHA